MYNTSLLIIISIVAIVAIFLLIWIITKNSSSHVAANQERMLNEQYQRLEEINKRQIDILNRQHAQQLEELFRTHHLQQESLRRETIAQFKSLAADTLSANSQSLSRTNSEQINAILTPLRQSIESFRIAVNDSYVKENASRQSLSDQISQLMRLNESISQEARNLTSALKGNSKVQGDWGEMILETLLENAGLERGINFEVQVTRHQSGDVIRDSNGKLLRPDVLIKLPDNHSIIVDSKVSLSAFVDYCNAENSYDKEVNAKKHLISVRKHIDELHNKMYQNAMRGAAEYVMMFIPNEAAYITAIQLDINLWKYAYDRGVMIVSPTHLFSVMSIVTQMWRQDKQNKNALLIAEKGGKLYDKLVLFIESFENIGKSLTTAQAAYDKSLNQLREGRGNVFRQAEDLKHLGAKTSKTIPERLTDSAD